MSENVYVAGRANGGHTDIYHTDPDCDRLQQVNNVLEYKKENIEGTRQHCQWCQHGNDIVGDNGRDGPWKDLDEISADDVDALQDEKPPEPTEGLR